MKKRGRKEERKTLGEAMATIRCGRVVNGIARPTKLAAMNKVGSS